MSAPLPTPRQLAFQDWEFGVFLHFGIRTFHEGHRDWDGKPMDPARYNPTDFNPRQWMRIIKEAGARYSVFTAKHHDGFANWPSAYTDYSVAATPWRHGTGDAVAEYVEACREFDIKVGLYYSPAEWGNPVYEDPRAYDDYFINQVRELLEPYGPVDMLWFDGCGSEGHEYEWSRIIDEIRRMQPEILIAHHGDPDYRWVGNESGLAPYPCWNVARELPYSVTTDQPVSYSEHPAWLPAECDCMMRANNWFYSDRDEVTVKSVEELLGLYYCSVGRGANLLLNIGPDRRGLLPEKDAEHLLAMGAEVRRRFGAPLATLAEMEREDSHLRYEAAEPFLLDHVVLQEEISRGERIRRFRIDILPTHGRRPIRVFTGTAVGHKVICRFPPVRARKVFIDVLEESEPVAWRQATLHHAGTA